MAPVAVVTDTCHYLPRELVERHAIAEVALHVHVDGEDRRESELHDYDAYYARLRDVSHLPRTSQPSIGEFVAVYGPLLDQGRDIVSVHLAGGVSGTCDSARQAIEQLGAEGRIELVDSSTGAGGEGMVVLAACAAAGDGRSVAEVAAHTREARVHMRIWFCLDTLEYLHRGGRIGGARAWLGSALKIKPILTVETEIAPVERVRTSAKAFDRMGDYLQKLHDEGADAWVVQHIQAPREANLLVERGRGIFGTPPLFVSEVGPVIGTYLGPGMIGAGGVPSRFMPDQSVRAAR